MSENIHEEIKRIDKIDQFEDKMITVDPEKVDQYTETYIEKVEQLLVALENSDLDQKQKVKVKEEILQMLGGVIGPADMVHQEESFRKQIDQFLEGTKAEKQTKDAPLGFTTLQKMLEGIRSYSADSEALANAEQELASGSFAQKSAAEHQAMVASCKRQLDVLASKVQLEQKTLDTLRQILDPENLANGLRLNSSWFTNATSGISQGIYLQGMAEEKAEVVIANIRTLENQTKKTLEIMFISAYFAAQKSGGDTDAVLLATFDALGNDVPPQLKELVDDAKKRASSAQSDTPATQFYYQGNYSAALENLANINEQNNAAVKLPGAYGSTRSYSAKEISDAYKDSTETRAGDSKKLADSLSRRGGLAGEKIKEGYIPLLFSGLEVDQSNPEKGLYKQGVYSEICLAKKLPDGSISVYLMPLYVPRQQQDQKFFTLTPESISKSEADEKFIEENLGLVMGKMESFKLLGSAAERVNSKFEPMKVLFIAGTQGKMPQDFVLKMKATARNLQAENPIADIKTHLADVKKDLDILKRIPVGKRGKFEQQIDQMIKAYEGVVKIVENDTINDFCRKILSDDFTEDTKLKWLLEDGLVFFTTIVTAVAFTMLTFGAGGLLLASAAGALGGLTGRELGSLMAGQTTELSATIKGEKFFNDETGEFEKLGLKDIVTRYGTNFAHQFVMTLGTVGLGRFLNKHLVKFAENYKNNPGLQGAFAKLSERVFSLGPQEVDILRNSAAVKQFFGNFFHETGEEIGEEALAIGIQQVGGAYGDLVGLFVAMRGGKAKQTFGGHEFQPIGFDLQGNTLISDYAITATSEEFASMTERIKDNFERDGYEVTVQEDGSIICKKSSAESTGGKPVALRFRTKTDTESKKATSVVDFAESQAKSLFPNDPEAQELYKKSLIGKTGLVETEQSTLDAKLKTVKPENAVNQFKLYDAKHFIVPANIANQHSFITSKLNGCTAVVIVAEMPNGERHVIVSHFPPFMAERNARELISLISPEIKGATKKTLLVVKDGKRNPDTKQLVDDVTNVLGADTAVIETRYKNQKRDGDGVLIINVPSTTKSSPSAYTNDAYVDFDIATNLAIDDSDGGIARRMALEKSFGEKINNEDWQVIWEMHKLGGSGKENLREKLALAQAHKSTNPRWKEIYHHALEKGFAGNVVENAQALFRKMGQGVRRILNPAVQAQYDRFLKIENLTDEQRLMLAELFPQGIELSSFKQTNTGNCYFLAALHVIKKSPLAPHLFAKMIRKRGTSWIVTFPGENPIELQEKELAGQNVWDKKKKQWVFKETVTGQLGDRILDVAFAKRRAGEFRNQGKVGETRQLVEGGYMMEGLEAFLSHAIISKPDLRGQPNRPLNTDAKAVRETEMLFHNFSRNPQNYLLTAATPSHLVTPFSRHHGGEFDRVVYYMDPDYKFVQTHAYSIIGVSHSTRTVIIANPHDSSKQHVLPYEKFFEYFSMVQGVKLDPEKIQEAAVHLDKNIEKGVFDEKLQPGVNHQYSVENNLHLILGKSCSIKVVEQNGLLFLLMADNNKPGVSYKIGTLSPGQEITLGRGTSNNMPGTVSANHAKIKYLGNGKIVLTDLNSSNGTSVIKGEKINVDPPSPTPEKKPGRPMDLKPGVAWDYAINKTRVLTLDLAKGVPFHFEAKNNDIVMGFYTGGEYNIKPGETVIIGRNNMPWLPESVSREHVKVTNRGDGVLIVEDLKSRGGTRATITFYN